MAEPSDPVVVTGAAGFLGAAAVRRLAGEGRRTVALVRPGSARARLAGLEGRVDVVEADLRDGAAVERALAAVRPAAVLHLAAHGAYEWQDEGARILETTVLGSYHLFTAARRLGVPLVVSAGTSSEYGYRDRPMSEDDRLEPNSVYAVGKAAQAHLARLLAAEGGTAFVVLRLFSVYGPGEDPRRLVPTLLRRARAGEPLRMASPDTVRDFVYLDDALDALLAFDRLAGLSGEVINLGSGRETRLDEVASLVQEVLGVRVPVEWNAMRRRWDASAWRADTARAEARLGWRARRTLRDGLAATAAWMAAHPEAPETAS
jgi:nucleoside-diphosphate-sugar epimerase